LTCRAPRLPPLTIFTAIEFREINICCAMLPLVLLSALDKWEAFRGSGKGHTQQMKRSTLRSPK
jgi:hypothetical protein